MRLSLKSTQLDKRKGFYIILAWLHTTKLFSHWLTGQQFSRAKLVHSIAFLYMDYSLPDGFIRSLLRKIFMSELAFNPYSADMHSEVSVWMELFVDTFVLLCLYWDILIFAWNTLKATVFIPSSMASSRSLLGLHQYERALEEYWLPCQQLGWRALVWPPCKRWVVPLHWYGRWRHAHLLHRGKPLWHPRTNLAQRLPPSAFRRHCHVAYMCKLQWWLLPLAWDSGCESLSEGILRIPTATPLSMLSCVLWP